MCKQRRLGRHLMAGLALVCHLAPSPALAASVTELQGLSFGTLALADNASQYQLQLHALGGMQRDPQIMVVNPGHPARYRIAGLAPFVPLQVHVSANNLITRLADGTRRVTSHFRITDFTIEDTGTTWLSSTDANGSREFRLGATLSTSGDGGYYLDAEFEKSYTITINY